MKRTIILALFAILLTTASALADAKIKTRQTIAERSTDNTTYIKGKRQRTEMNDAQHISITQCDLNRDLQIAPGTKSYTVSYYDDGTPADGRSGTNTSAPSTKGGTMYVTTTTRDTGERKQMFGYTARHIIQTIETESTPDACFPNKSKMEMDMWVIDAEFGIACAQTATYRQYNGAKVGGCNDKLVPKTIGTGKTGFPLYQKMTMFDGSGAENMSMIQEVIELSKAVLDQKLFEAPAEYREVKDSAALYATAPTAPAYNEQQPSSGFGNTVRETATTRSEAAPTVGPKKAGTVRIGVAGVKTGAVGEGINATDLSAAVRNSLGEFLKGTNVEVISLESKLAAAQSAEAKQKECDYILVATVSHKKGGGGFGGFGKMLGSVVSQIGIGHTGSTAGNIAGQIATSSIVSASQMSGNVKAKDELTLDLLIQSSIEGKAILTKQLKAKAKSNGDDIISAIVEQAAQAIIDAVGK